MKLIILTLILALTGCGAADRLGASLTGYAESCINGVSYLQFASGATVAYLPNGNIKTCNNK